MPRSSIHPPLASAFTMKVAGPEIVVLLNLWVTTTVTTLFISALPKITGVMSLVTIGLVMAGAIGAVESITRLMMPDCEVLPNESVAVTATS